MENSYFPFDFRIIPVVVINRAEDTVPTVKALRDGGIMTAEITFRTECAGNAIATAVREFSDMVIGAGTVINPSQCEEAISAGAAFIVSPGYSPDVHSVCKKYNIPYLPGAVTATEIMNLITNGIYTVKFFPAEASGGVKTIKALSAAFPDIRFIPTGGISMINAEEYLALPCVQAIGGSWMLKGSAEEIRKLSTQATEALK